MNRHPDLAHLDRGDGVCRNLTSNNLCSVYEDRPDVCNTRTMFKKLWSQYMSWDEYVHEAEVACKYLDNLINDAGHDVVLE